MRELKITDHDRKVIEEISSLSGLGKDIIRDVWEHTIFHFLSKVVENPHGLNQFTIPMFGTVGVKFVKDFEDSSGNLQTEINIFASVNDGVKRLIGNLLTENYSVMKELLDKRIDSAIVKSLMN